jgi:hypothetical protein
MGHNLSDDAIKSAMVALAQEDDRKAWEVAGSSLDANQFASLLELAAQDLESKPDKLAALLVGITPIVFSQMLSLATPTAFNLLKNSPPSEPFLHHLTLHTHALQERLDSIYIRIQTIQEELLQLYPQDVDPQTLTQLKLYLEDLQLLLQQLDDAFNQTLSLAWGAARSELIDKLSTLKEQCERCLRLTVGKAATSTEYATGLYLYIEERLGSVFGIGGVDADALYDDDPAVGALAKLSIWYLDDFYAVGLLKKDASSYTQSDEAFNAAEKRLTELGLHKISDVKRAWICSRATLQHFLQHS